MRAEVFDDAGEELRGRGEIEEAITADVLFLVDAVELGLEAGIVGGVVEVEREVADLLDEAIQPGIAGIDVAELEDAFAHVGRKFIAQRAARHPDDGECCGQQAGLLQVEERRQQFALGQVARGAEDHHDSRFGNPLLAFGNLG